MPIASATPSSASIGNPEMRWNGGGKLCASSRRRGPATASSAARHARSSASAAARFASKSGGQRAVAAVNVVPSRRRQRMQRRALRRCAARDRSARASAVDPRVDVARQRPPDRAPRARDPRRAAGLKSNSALLKIVRRIFGPIEAESRDAPDSASRVRRAASRCRRRRAGWRGSHCDRRAPSCARPSGPRHWSSASAPENCTR